MIMMIIMIKRDNVGHCVAWEFTASEHESANNGRRGSLAHRYLDVHAANRHNTFPLRFQ